MLSIQPESAKLGTVLVLLLSGCAGYQVGAHSMFRPDIRTVYVPIFESTSFRRHLGERLTEAVVKEIEDRTPYKVVHTPDADSVLNGQIVAEQKSVLAEDAFDVPREIETNLVVQVQWYDRHHGLIMQSSALSIAPIALSIAEASSFIPEAGQSGVTAQQEAINRLARQIVSQMELPW